MLRKWIGLFGVLLVCVAGLRAQDVLDRIVAVVDNTIILRSELQQFAYSLAIQSGVDPLKEPEKFNDIMQKTLDDLITQKALLVKAKEDSVEVNERQVDAVLDQQIQQMVQQLGSEKSVEDYFGSPLRQIRREFRQEVEERLLVQRLREIKSFETQISRREVEEFYRTFRDSLPVLKEAVKIRHILVNVRPSETAINAAREKAEEVVKRLQKGEDFSELAKQFSEGPSGPKGGDLGLTARGDMVKEFEQVAFSLEPGQISDIVQTQFGLHIIQLVERVGEKIHTRHILFRVDTSPEDETRTVEWLRVLRQQIRAGELTFEAAVEKHSKDQDSSSKHGDLGWFELEAFQIPAFKTAVVGLNPGDISEPIKTRFGYHLIQVQERRDERQLDIQEDWEQIENWALDLKRRKEFEKFIASIKKDVYIEIKQL
ncbi:MAG: peptidylprolyl isomerase [bacterium]